MKTLCISFLLTFLLFSNTQAQESFSSEYKFYTFLNDKNLDKEAILVLKGLTKLTLNASQKDSLNFALGWHYYTKKALDSSTNYLLNVSTEDKRYNQAVFFASSNFIIQKKLTNAALILQKIDTSITDNRALATFQKAGMALLNRNYTMYDSINKVQVFDKYYLEAEQTKLNDIKKQMVKQKNKSPLLAGTLSAIIPGAGKWYVGKKKQAIGSFLPLCALAFLTKELYNKTDIKTDLRFWLFTTFFTTFYVGNIVGSVELAKIVNRNNKEIYDNQIIFNMHIPIRNFFN